MIKFHQNSYEVLSNKPAGQNQFEDDFCKSWFKENLGLSHFAFTKSCTQSLELAILSLNLEPGSEVIMPSYGFVSLANAVNNLGLKCVFVDCEAATMNIDASQIEGALTPKTKAIISINYGGVSCDYDTIRALCTKHQLYLIEDNAHGILGKYKDEFLGSIGDIACFSFDHLKNFTCYQGGGIAINNPELLQNFQISSEFGTNRIARLQGKVDFYEWRGKGLNSIIAKPLIGILSSQLKDASTILKQFNLLWAYYQQKLSPLAEAGQIELSQIPEYAEHQAHIFWIKTKDKQERKALMDYLMEQKIETSSHYEPLHNSAYGKEAGVFRGSDNNTSEESSKLLRLPFHLGLSEADADQVCQAILSFYQ